MKTLFKIVFSPVILAWWLIKIAFRIIWLPVTILWKIMDWVVPEITGPIRSLMPFNIGPANKQISSAVQKGRSVCVYDERGRRILVKPGLLAGYTANSLSIRRGRSVVTYNANGRRILVR